MSSVAPSAPISNRPAQRRGSSFGSGPRRGTDPEGGERSAWKGLCGPSGLNLDHERIPHIQEQVYERLVPLLVVPPEPLPLSQFTQKCCDVLLPVLEKEAELSVHGFKSQWGRLNEFVCPELAKRAGLEDSGFNREAKTVRLDLRMPAGSDATSAATAEAAAQPAAAAAIGSALASASPAVPLPMALSSAPNTAARVAGASAAAAKPAGGMRTSLPQPAVGIGRMAVPLAVPPALCAYCHDMHSMRQCSEFQAMLHAIYEAGFKAGAASAHDPDVPAPSSTNAGSPQDKPASVSPVDGSPQR